MLETASSPEFFSVTPSDTVDLVPLSTNADPRTRGISTNTDGNVVVHNNFGTPVTIYFIAGVTRPIRTTRILATNTTATGIVAYY